MALTRRHPANVALIDRARVGDRVADRVSSALGSWRFIVAQTVVVAAWIAVNVLVVALRWDAYPFIALNLAFSTQAAYAAPLLQLASNRASAHDEARADADHTHGLETHAMLLALIGAVERARTIDDIHAVDWRALLAGHDPAAAVGYSPQDEHPTA